MKNADAVHTLLQWHINEEFHFQVWNISGSMWKLEADDSGQG